MDSDEYVVEEYVKPTRIGKKLVNDERGDLLGNFDDEDNKFTKKKAKAATLMSEENPFADDDDDDDVDDNDDEVDADGDENGDEDSDKGDDEDDDEEGDEDDNEATEALEDDDNEADDSIELAQEATDHDLNESIEEAEEATEHDTSAKSADAKQNQKDKAKKKAKRKKEKAKEVVKPTSLSDDQIQALIKGASKKNRFVLYVTNLNYGTTRDALNEFFRVAGEVKSIRIPKVRRSAYAFIEMVDLDGFTKALALHNHVLDKYTIKIQISEGGKKKSANKKNILKQKNRKLAEMRQEGKQFGRSGKGYSKTIKNEIKQQKMQMERRLNKKRK